MQTTQTQKATGTNGYTPSLSVRSRAPTDKAAKRPNLPKLPLASSENHPEHLKWLCFYFWDLAKLEALQKLSTGLSKRSDLIPLRFALYESIRHSKKECQEALNYVIGDGLLLFAFAQTKVFCASKVPA